MGVFKPKENPFHKLEERLRAEELARRSERKVSAQLCGMAFRKWNKYIVHLLKQLEKALGQSSAWEGRNLCVGVFAPLDNGFRSVGWRLYWVRPYGLHHHWVVFRECESLDVVTIALKLNKSGQPVSFNVFREEDGAHVVTRGLSGDELVSILQQMFV
jgi:hypothetical protein